MRMFLSGKTGTGPILFFYGFLFLFLLFQKGKAQSISFPNGSMQLTVRGNDRLLEGAVIMVFKKDSTHPLKIELTDNQGAGKLSKLSPGIYNLTIDYTGFKHFVLDNIHITLQEPSYTNHLIELKPSATTLSGVEVSAKKPFMERKSGKLIVNVEGSILSAGSSVFDVLERSPGVSIDNNDNIGLAGKQGVIVMIDGKPSPLSGTELVNWLKTLSSSLIDKIEIITNPSTHFDAAGSSGIINIRMKKDTRQGTNGSAVLGYGQGVYPKVNTGINLNHRNRHFNFFGNYSYNYRTILSNSLRERLFYKEDQSNDKSFLQDNYLTIAFQPHSLRTGVDFFPNSKTTIGVLLTGFTNRFSPKADNHTQIYDSANNFTGSFKTFNRSDDQWNNGSANLNFRRLLDTTGSFLSADLDYAGFGNQTYQRYSTQYSDLGGSPSQPLNILFTDQNNRLTIQSFKLDYSHSLISLHGSIDAGIKMSKVHSDSRVLFYDQSGGGNVYDSSKSNWFLYDENIIAGFVSLSASVGKLSIQAGLRGERTQTTGNQIVYNQRTDTAYFNLFPSVFLSYPLNPSHQLTLSYSRRINRPGYRSLNPFRIYSNPLNYSEGNPYLQPEFTQSFEIAETFQQKFTASLHISRTIRQINFITFPVPGPEKITVQSPKNAGDFFYSGLTVSGTLRPFGFWSSVNNLIAYFSSYQGVFDKTTLDENRFAFSWNSTNAITLSKSLTAELSANYTSLERSAFTLVQPVFMLSAGLQKNLASGRGSIRLNVTDILLSNFYRGDIRFSNYKEYVDNRGDSRVVNLVFTYRFGRSQIAAARKRAAGSEEEKSRAN